MSHTNLSESYFFTALHSVVDNIRDSLHLPRYQRGNRSLADNLSNKNQGVTNESKQLGTEEEAEEYDIPDEIEEIIGMLLVWASGLY